MCTDAEDIFAYMRENQIGTTFALFYRASRP